eukprot:TRINITY_DN7558_c3_g1_i1.p1 TRINITY_DN7558_c3_g1~~TRINITY_DN7558_c3_g1_i1.p1  ORF type:complete len:340 (+),score=121.36 TRINITY_DN7558_c3_g1_i1:465-1484(+)
MWSSGVDGEFLLKPEDLPNSAWLRNMFLSQLESIRSSSLVIQKTHDRLLRLQKENENLLEGLDRKRGRHEAVVHPVESKGKAKAKGTPLLSSQGKRDSLRRKDLTASSSSSSSSSSPSSSSPHSNSSGASSSLALRTKRTSPTLSLGRARHVEASGVACVLGPPRLLLPPPPPPAVVGDPPAASSASGSILSTSEPYYTSRGEWFLQRERSELKIISQNSLVLPDWSLRESKLRLPDSDPVLEASLSDETFLKRHSKHELAEVKRKRWDLQSLRALRETQRLKERLLLLEAPSNSPVIHSVEPCPMAITHIVVEETLPVSVFGAPLPRLEDKHFSLKWT